MVWIHVAFFHRLDGPSFTEEQPYRGWPAFWCGFVAEAAKLGAVAQKRNNKAQHKHAVKENKALHERSTKSGLAPAPGAKD